MMDRREEEGDGDGEDRGRIWGIGIDTFISITVSFVFSSQEASHNRSPAPSMETRNVPTARKLILFCSRNGVI